MKKTLILIASLFSIGSLVHARSSIICANADTSFTYSRQLSMSGAYIDVKEIQLNGLSDQDDCYDDHSIIFNVTEKRILNIKPVSNNGSQITYVGKATGELTSNEEITTFADIWVICVEEIYPVCGSCP